MEHAADGDVVREAMKLGPALATQLFDHGIGGGHRERHHQQKTEHAESDEGPLDHIADNRLQPPVAIIGQVSQQVREAVEERVEAQQAALFQQPVPAADFAQRCDQQREDEEDQCQHTGGTRDELHRIGPQLAAPGIDQDEHGRQQAIEEKKLPVKA